MTSRWDPWYGCHRYSEGCRYCYIHKGALKRGIDINIITKGPRFDAPIRKNKDGSYKIKSGTLVYLGFSTDFLLEEGDQYRQECWKMIKERQDLNFLFLTKRIERFEMCIPLDWQDGYDNVIVCCTIENQEKAEERLSIFKHLSIKHKQITCQPLLGPLNLSDYLESIELVVVGGESDSNGRLLDYQWVLDIREQCLKNNVHFSFRQCGTHFHKDGIIYTIPTRQLMSQARKAMIDF